MKDPVIIINGAEVLEVLDTEYEHQQYQWELKCREVEGQFRKKTSRSVKNGKEYEYTGWYKLKPGGGLESIGKGAPDFKKYYPPEPKRKYSFQRGEFEGHLIISGEDYKANVKLFKGCLAFRLEDCQNFGHALYRNPDKIIYPFRKDSVRKGGVSSDRSLRRAGLKIIPVEPSRERELDDNCRGDGDCMECEHQDECPVVAEVS